MQAYLTDALELAIRLLHFTAGIAWIGSSFYFVWLDNSLDKPPQWKAEQGVKGDLWSVHGGGFYEIAKYQVAPAAMPDKLHWFKWEAYTTWISGFLLLTLVYYVGADLYLADRSKSDLLTSVLIGLGTGSIILAWLVYDALCKTTLVDSGLAFAVVMLGMIGLWAYALEQVFSDRAAYLHVGAAIGTCMVANVFFVIIPNQKKTVAAMLAGDTPDPALGKEAKQRSTHNNYATLPILFLMISHHYPATYGYTLQGLSAGWLILVILAAIGMWIRHFFNLRHQGEFKPMVLGSGIAAFFVLVLVTAPWPETTTINTNMVDNQTAGSVNDQNRRPVISDTDALTIVTTHCQSCHAVNPTAGFTAAPAGVVLETLADVQQYKDQIYAQSVASQAMPLGNLTQMTNEERMQLGQWIEQLP